MNDLYILYASKINVKVILTFQGINLYQNIYKQSLSLRLFKLIYAGRNARPCIQINVHAGPHIQINVYAGPRIQISVHAGPHIQINVHAKPAGKIN